MLFHFLFSEGNEKISELLLKNGADINALDDERETPLFKSVHKYGGMFLFWFRKFFFFQILIFNINFNVILIVIS